MPWLTPLLMYWSAPSGAPFLCAKLSAASSAFFCCSPPEALSFKESLACLSLSMMLNLIVRWLLWICLGWTRLGDCGMRKVAQD
ncbi:hypothetical protein F5Y15DRAFT_373331 [Xylariaceae sp. FL0016]|nr:hypothetical protein F5Y15DRAFT_373331 [Xylariaceae sp. FL0016]